MSTAHSIYSQLFKLLYKLNYLPFTILDINHIPSCISADSALQLYQVSHKSNQPFRRSCTYKVHGRMDRQTDRQGDLYTTLKLFCRGIKRYVSTINRASGFFLSIQSSYIRIQTELSKKLWQRYSSL